MKIYIALAMLTLATGAANAADKPSPNKPSPDKPAIAKPVEGRQCFWTRQADGFAAQDDHTVNVRVSSRDVYRFEMMGHCPDIDWNQQIALVSRGSDSICTGVDAEIITRSPIGPMRCPVSHIHKLTPDEIAALPKKARP